jgi:hypothetical protein
MTKDPALMFIHDGLSLAQIAQQCAGQPGCSLRSLKRRCAQGSWVARRATHRLDIAALVEDGRNADHPSVAPPVAPVGPAGGPVAPVPVPNASSGLYEAAIAKALDALARDRADEVLGAYEQLDAAWLGAVRATFLVTTDAVAWLSAHRAELIDSGDVEVDEETGAEAPSLTVRDSKVSLKQRATAVAVLATAVSLRSRLAADDPISTARRSQAATRQAEAAAQYAQMRVAGNLPPERVAIEFEALMTKQLGRLKNALPEDAYGDLLDAIERDARQQLAATGESVLSDDDKPSTH